MGISIHSQKLATRQAKYIVSVCNTYYVPCSMFVCSCVNMCVCYMCLCNVHMCGVWTETIHIHVALALFMWSFGLHTGPGLVFCRCVSARSYLLLSSHLYFLVNDSFLCCYAVRAMVEREYSYVLGNVSVPLLHIWCNFQWMKWYVMSSVELNSIDDE